MKLNLNKKFQPMKVDEGDEVYRNGIFEFNITKLIAHIKSNADQVPVETISLDGFWECSQLDETTIEEADLANPIILAEISPGRCNVIDGNHRLARAKRDGVSVLPGF